MRKSITITLLALMLAAPVAAETTITHSEAINVWGRTPLTAAIERAVERTELQADPAPVVSNEERSLRGWKALVLGVLVGGTAGAVSEWARDRSITDFLREQAHLGRLPSGAQVDAPVSPEKVTKAALVGGAVGTVIMVPVALAW